MGPRVRDVRPQGAFGVVPRACPWDCTGEVKPAPLGNNHHESEVNDERICWKITEGESFKWQGI